MTLCLLGLAAAQPAVADDAPAAVPRALLQDYLADHDTFTLIDARSPEEFAAAHIEGALNIPFDADVNYSAVLPADRAAPVVVYCRTGRRAGLLRDSLVAAGYADVRVLDEAQTRWFATQSADTPAGETPAPAAPTDEDSGPR